MVFLKFYIGKKTSFDNYLTFIFKRQKKELSTHVLGSYNYSNAWKKFIMTLTDLIVAVLNNRFRNRNSLHAEINQYSSFFISLF